MFAKTGISVQQMMRLLEIKQCLELEFLPFTEKDIRNLLQSFRKVDLKDQSIDLLSGNMHHLSKRMEYLVMQCQPNSPQLVHEELQQIHPDDMEEMDLRWKMAIFGVLDGLVVIELDVIRQEDQGSLIMHSLAFSSFKFLAQRGIQ
ncbi:protein FAR1-related sequence 11 [Tanacetum coccineum]